VLPMQLFMSQGKGDRTENAEKEITNCAWGWGKEIQTCSQRTKCKAIEEEEQESVGFRLEGENFQSKRES